MIFRMRDLWAWFGGHVLRLLPGFLVFTGGAWLCSQLDSPHDVPLAYIVGVVCASVMSVWDGARVLRRDE